MLGIRRREFISLLGGAAAAWPLTATAQQQTALPVIGYLGTASTESQTKHIAALRKGLSETGYVEGRSVIIEYRFEEEKSDRLADSAADLVRRRVAVIFAVSNSSAVAAKAATATIPIVFNIGGDPVQLGLVASLNRPGGNATGMSYLATDTVAKKKLEVLHDALPNATIMAALVNPLNPTGEADAWQAQEAAGVLGLQLHLLNASNERELDTAFTTLLERRAEALLIEGDPFFSTRLKQLVALTVRHAIPAIYQGREFPDAGGLMSYGADRYDSSRLAGICIGRILNGEKPAGLPVQQSTKAELVINLVTAKALGLDVPATVLARADEVIE
jgi:putative ABC transport system substrate-binding protein